MSKQFEKITIKYDTNTGSNEEVDIYRIYNNTTDYQYFYYANGDSVELHGTDSFIDLLAAAIAVGGYRIHNSYSYIVKSISYLDLPEKLQKLF